jgi:uncharacterized damage-inducible protein DinB
MQMSEARRLFEYTEWANARMTEVLLTFSDEQLDQVIPSSFPSIRETLSHIFSTEWIWLRRWKGESPSVAPPWGGEITTLVSEYGYLRNERSDYLRSLTDADLERNIAYRSMKGDPFTHPLAELFRHVVNHSSYHRGQLTTMIRQAGAVPPGTDYILFVREQGAV